MIENHDNSVEETYAAEFPMKAALGFSIGTSFIIFVSILCMAEAVIFSIPVMSGIAATVTLVSAWSVFGIGVYWKRLLFAHLLGALPFVAVVLSVAILAVSESASLDEILVAFLSSLAIVPAISAMSQMVFWFARGMRGWQFVMPDQPLAPAFRVNDILLGTSLVAIGLAGIQLSVALYTNQLANGPLADSSNAGAARQLAISMFASVALFSCLGTGFSYPIIRLVFRPDGKTNGCAAAAIYVMGCFMALLLALSFTFASAGGALGEVIMTLGGMMAGFGFAIGMPLATAKNAGVRFTCPSRESARTVSESARKEDDPPNDGEEST